MVSCLVHLNGGDERAPSLSNDVHRALDGRELRSEWCSHASISDLNVSIVTGQIFLLISLTLTLTLEE